MGAPSKRRPHQQPKGSKSPPSGLSWVNAGFEPGHIFSAPESMHAKTLGGGGQPRERIRTAPGGTYLDATGHLRTLPSNPARRARAMAGTARKLAAQQAARAVAEAKRKRPKIPRSITGKQLTSILTRLGYQQAGSARGGATFTSPGKPNIHFMPTDSINVARVMPHVAAAIREFFERGHTL